MKTGHPKKLEGFSLVEVSFAIGVFAFCLVSLLALLPVGVKSGNNAAEEMLALNAATAIIADLKATPKGMDKSPIYGLSVVASGTNADGVETKYADDSWVLSPSDIGQRYRITTTTFPSDGISPLRVVLQISWPASVPPNGAAGVVTVFGAFNSD